MWGEVVDFGQDWSRRKGHPVSHRFKTFPHTAWRGGFYIGGWVDKWIKEDIAAESHLNEITRWRFLFAKRVLTRSPGKIEWSADASEIYHGFLSFSPKRFQNRKVTFGTKSSVVTLSSFTAFCLKRINTITGDFMDAKDLLKRVKEDHIKFISYQFTDINGAVNL